jgi:hypothetical protein
MKKTQLLIAFALLISVALASCSKDKNDAGNSSNNNPGNDSVTYIINGGSFVNKHISFHSDPKQNQNGASAGHIGYLKINLTDTPPGGSTVTQGLDIAYPQATTGTANVNDPITNIYPGTTDKHAYFLLQLQENGKNKILDRDSENPINTPGKINITKCESVGGVVEGDFSGTVSDGTGSNAPKYTITKGHFVVTRKS